MESIVLELQREAMDSNSNISNLLRKSLVIARKLKVKEFEEWVTLELNGYSRIKREDIPKYRRINAQLEGILPYSNWIPIEFESDEITKLVTQPEVNSTITEIDSLSKDESQFLIWKLTTNKKMIISEWVQEEVEDFRLIFPKQQFKTIVNTVRNIILEWTIRLEEDGILGEGILFSDKEKQEANKHNYTVNNFYGNTSGVQIQQHTQNSSQTQINEVDLEKIESFISTLQQNISNIELDNSSKRNIEKEIEKISKQLGSSKPKASVLRESMSTIRNVLEGVTGSLIASGLLHELSKISM